MPIAKLNRAIFRLSGGGVSKWLDGLITNSIAKDGLSFAALLTPQGKIIADFFIAQNDDHIYLETAAKFSADLYKRLRLYKLRAPIEIEDLSDTHSVYAIWATEEDGGEGAEGQADPRLPALGYRLITDSDLASPASTDDYNAHRLSLGIPDSEWDFETVTTFPADANMDILGGVDFKKGCFVGQEVVSRMKRMTTVKKRFRGVIISGETQVQAGDKITSGERVIGEILHLHATKAGGQAGMALIRLDRWAAATQNPMVSGADIQIMGGPKGEQN